MDCSECGDKLLVVNTKSQTHSYCLSCKKLTPFKEDEPEEEHTDDYSLHTRLDDVPKNDWKELGEWDE